MSSVLAGLSRTKEEMARKQSPGGVPDSTPASINSWFSPSSPSDISPIATHTIHLPGGPLGDPMRVSDLGRDYGEVGRGETKVFEERHFVCTVFRPGGNGDGDDKQREDLLDNFSAYSQKIAYACSYDDYELRDITIPMWYFRLLLMSAHALSGGCARYGIETTATDVFYIVLDGGSVNVSTQVRDDHEMRARAVRN